MTSADALEEEDSKPDTSDDDEEEWVPKASRRKKFSKMIRSFMNSSEPMLTFSNALTTFERCLVHRIAHQWQIEHQSYGEGKERYIVKSLLHHQAAAIGVCFVGKVLTTQML